MPTGTTRSRSDHKKRVDYFFGSTTSHRREITHTLKGLSELGRVIVFGGAIRDMALRGTREPPSDIDVVLESAGPEDVESFMSTIGATRNRFGGFRFSTSRWKFDVWRLEDTWALRNHLVHGASGEALLKTTFFDWDAVAYDFSNRKLLVSDGYFERLERRIIDINLPDNPNPIGNARRALRIFVSGNAALSPRLADFVVKTLATEGGAEDSFFQDFLRQYECANGKPVCKRMEQLPLDEV